MNDATRASWPWGLAVAAIVAAGALVHDRVRPPVGPGVTTIVDAQLVASRQRIAVAEAAVRFAALVAQDHAIDLAIDRFVGAVSEADRQEARRSLDRALRLERDLTAAKLRLARARAADRRARSRR